ncbi:MAG: DUF5011 domain-containing protein [Ruminococcaceae bacterium]|nr:DUF5011 domain-containing protein [Oscillospiraceae bacterium]
MRELWLKWSNAMRAAVIGGALVVLAALVIGVLSLANGYFILNPQPRVMLQGEKTLVIEAFAEYEDAGAKAALGKQDLTDQIVTIGAVNPAIPGEYTMIYRLTYGEKQYSAERKVTVVDKVAPELTLTGDAQMTVSLLRLYQEPGFTANDRCDGDLTGKVQVAQTENEDGTVTITYTVSDASGNQATASRTLTIRDIVAPTITLSGNYHVYVSVGRSFSDPGVSASDDVDGDLTGKIKKSGSVDTSATGTYTLNYEVTDSSGNKATASRKVTVYKDDGSSPNRIYLTFDDGPTSNITPRVLNILRENNVKATFFILNYGETGREIIRQMIADGHTVAIHGYSHEYSVIYASDDAFMNNIYKLRNKLINDFGYESNIIRFPGGSSNTVSRNYSYGIMSRLVRRVEDEGFVYFDWNVSSGDASGNSVSSSTIYNNVINGLRPGRNNVVLMHDSYYKSTTAAALQDIIDYGRGNGYTFLPLTESTRPVHQGVNN